MQRRLTDFYPPAVSPGSFGALTTLNMSATAAAHYSPNPTSHSSPSNGRKRKASTLASSPSIASFSNAPKRTPLRQMILDAGQKRIGIQHCAKCEMVYNIDDKKDVASHEEFHNRFTRTKYFRVTATQIENWKSSLYYEHTSSPVRGLLFRLSAASTATLRKRVEDIVKSVVNVETGYYEDMSTVWDLERRRQAIVLIALGSSATTEPFAKVKDLKIEDDENTPQKQPQPPPSMPGDAAAFVGALLLIDAVNTATLLPDNKHFKGQFVGVNRIWTHATLRGRGVAVALLDAARRLAVRTGQPSLARTRVAFIDPTEAGIRLARRFVSGKNLNESTAPNISSNPASVSAINSQRYIVHNPI